MTRVPPFPTELNRYDAEEKEAFRERSGDPPGMYVPEESHGGIILINHLNKDDRPLAESEEGRRSIKEKAGHLAVTDTEREERVPGAATQASPRPRTALGRRAGRKTPK